MTDDRSPSRHQKPVLVVEDHDDTRELVEALLRLEGYAVTSAHDGLSALASVAEEPPCLILLDLAMPGMDGITFGQRLRRLEDQDTSHTPIVLMTAEPSAREAMRVVGAADLIAKPILFERMREVLHQHCPHE